MSLLSELNVYLEKAFYGSDLLDGPILPMLDCHHGHEHYLGYRRRTGHTIHRNGQEWTEMNRNGQKWSFSNA